MYIAISYMPPGIVDSLIISSQHAGLIMIFSRL